MGRIKFWQWLWGTALCLNALLIAEQVMQYFTGYFIADLHFGGWIIGFTVLTLVVTLIRAFSWPARQRRQRQGSKWWQVGGLILFTLLYSGFGFVCWTFMQVSTPGVAFSLSAVGKIAAYPSPSGQRAVIFKEVSTLSDAGFIYAYEQRGLFQRPALMRADDDDSRVAIASEWSTQNDAIRGMFFEPTRLELEWSDDESSLVWSLQPNSDVSYSGTVEFRQ